MPGYFPKPYPDELLYSVIARYHLTSPNNAAYQTVEDMFGSQHSNAVFDLPTHLEKLVSYLPMGSSLTKEKILYKNTLYPYYSTFLSPEKAQRLMETMYVYKENMQSLIGNNGKFVLMPEYFRFCTECNDEDLSTYKELYWHRVHQAPGVLICPKHQSPLHESSVKTRSNSRTKFTPATTENCQSIIPKTLFPSEYTNHLTRLSKDVQYLLDNPISPVKSEEQTFRFLKNLAEKKLINIDDKVYIEELVNRFNAYYGRSFLSFMHSAVENDINNNWLLRIIKKSRKVYHPIRHLLLVGYLSNSIKDFFKTDLSGTLSQPFGKGPWLCLNPAAEHYLKSVIEEIEITRSTSHNKPLGIFTCSCGFVYTQKGPRINTQDQYTYSSVIEYGSVWKEALKKYVEIDKRSISDIAKKLKVSFPTIRKHLLELNLLKQEKGSKGLEKNDREQWLELMKTNPSLTKSQLRVLNSSLFQRLYKKDTKWLHEHSPKLKVKQPKKQTEAWLAEDAQLYEIVRSRMADVMNRKEKPERISVARIAEWTGKQHLIQRNLSKLPKTEALIASLIESREKYEKRCIHWAGMHLYENGEVINKTKIRHLANCRTYSKEINELLDEVFLKYVNP